MSKKEVSLRQKKVSEQIKRVVTEYIMVDLLSENPIKNMFLITKVQVSADLQNANFYIRVEHGDERVKKLIKDILNDFSVQIKQRIVEKMVLKYTPKVNFLFDVSESDYKKPHVEHISADDLIF